MRSGGPHRRQNLVCEVLRLLSYMQALNSVLSLTFRAVKTPPNQFAESVFFYKKTLKQFEEPKMNNLKFLSIKNVELGPPYEISTEAGSVAGRTSATAVGK